jgi:NADH-quinone oxidoreductase E subunit
MDEQLTQQVNTVVQRYGADREALVEILRDLNLQAGHLTEDHLDLLADELQVPSSQVYGVASFYSMISLKPLGRHVIRLCEDAPCHVAGGQEIWETLEHELGISFGETTLDGEWSLLTTSCIGACSVGPVMMVDEEIYGNLTPDKVREILAQYQKESIGGEV